MQEGVDRFIEHFCCNMTTDVKDIELLIESFNDQCSMLSVGLVAPLKTRTRAVSKTDPWMSDSDVSAEIEELWKATGLEGHYILRILDFLLII